MKELLKLHFRNKRFIRSHFPTTWTTGSSFLIPLDVLLCRYQKKCCITYCGNDLRWLLLIAENDGQHIEHLLRKSDDTRKWISLLIVCGFGYEDSKNTIWHNLGGWNTTLRVPQRLNDLEIFFFSVMDNIVMYIIQYSWMKL